MIELISVFLAKGGGGGWSSGGSSGGSKGWSRRGDPAVWQG